MKIARSKAGFVLGILAVLAMVCVMMLITDERLSRQLDGVDITWDEINPKPPIGGPTEVAQGPGRLPAP